MKGFYFGRASDVGPVGVFRSFKATADQIKVCSPFFGENPERLRR
jgi:hypothetical protein